MISSRLSFSPISPGSYTFANYIYTVYASTSPNYSLMSFNLVPRKLFSPIPTALMLFGQSSPICHCIQVAILPCALRTITRSSAYMIFLRAYVVLILLVISSITKMNDFQDVDARGIAVDIAAMGRL